MVYCCKITLYYCIKHKKINRFNAHNVANFHATLTHFPDKLSSKRNCIDLINNEYNSDIKHPINVELCEGACTN